MEGMEAGRDEQGPVSEKRTPGRPVTRTIAIDATAEEIAQAIFRAAKPPDPGQRKNKRPRGN